MSATSTENSTLGVSNQGEFRSRPAAAKALDEPKVSMASRTSFEFSH
jgi:hypothetical protein